ncbi:MAG: biotin--[acetyl-CoA-carboxylase] ligase, partial [Gordonia amarae]
LLIAGEQTAGRGRLDRTWASPSGASVSISMLLQPSPEFARWGWLSLLTGMAVTSALEEIAPKGSTVQLKWPNDVLIDGAKVCGILSEYAPAADGGIAIIGIGINTDMTPEQLPVPTATSLGIATGAPVDIQTLAGDVLAQLDAVLYGWPDDLIALAAAYRDRCDTIGRRVRLIAPGDQDVIGTAVDVDSDGRVILETSAGERIVATAGDVTHLRVAD